MYFLDGLDWQEEIKLKKDNYLVWYDSTAIPFVFFGDGVIYKKNGEDRVHNRLLKSLRNITKKEDFHYGLSHSNRIQSFNISENSRKEINKFLLEYCKIYHNSSDDFGTFIRDSSKLIFGRCWISNNVIAFWNTKSQIQSMHVNNLLKAFNLDLDKTQIFCKNVSRVSVSKFLESKTDSKNIKKVEELIYKLHTISCTKSVPEGFGSKIIKGNMSIEKYRQLRYSSSD